MSVLDYLKNLTGEAKARASHTIHDPRARQQTQLVAGRRFWGAVVNYPLSRIQNDMLRPDLNRDPITGEKIKKIEFDAAAWRFIDDVVIGATCGQLVRSYAFAYNNNKSFLDVHNASRKLEGFGMSAEAYDDAPRKLSDEIKAGRDHPLYDLVNHSSNAGELLDKFVHGQLEINPSNVAKLQRNLSAMAELCEEKAALREAYDSVRDPQAQAEAEKRGDKNDASGYIRDVVRLDKITTPRQAQILSGFVAALMVDAAKPLGTDMFVPQSDVFMEPADAVKLSEFVDLQMKARGFVPNVSLNEDDRPFPDMPEGMMIKQEYNQRTGEAAGCRKLTQEETLSFSNAMHGYLKNELNGKIENMLRYVDMHFDEIEDSISRSQEDATPAPMPVWDKQATAGASIANIQDKIRNVWAAGRSTSPTEMAKSTFTVAVAAVKHIIRPEARQESRKLFDRALASQISSYLPKVFEEGAKSFLRYSGGEYTAEGGKERRGGYNKIDPHLLEEKYKHDIKKEWAEAHEDKKNIPAIPDEELRERIARRRTEKGVRAFAENGKDYYLEPASLKGLDALINATQTGKLEGNLFDKEAFHNNLKSNTFRLVTSPIATSVVTVAAKELYALPKGLAIDAAGRASSLLSGAIKAGHCHTPESVRHMEALQTSHPAVAAVMKKEMYRNLPEIAAKPASKRSSEDYKILASYYTDLSEASLSMAKEVLEPYSIEIKSDKISSTDEAVTKVLRHSAENVPDAMLALAYVQAFLEISAEKTSSLDYVDPTELFIKHGDLRRFANFIDDQTKAAKLVVAEEGQIKGVEAGSLLERNEKTGELEPAREETLVRYANVIVDELKERVDIDNLLYAVKGKNSETYLNKIEEAVFAPTHFKVGNQDKKNPAADTEASSELVAKWQETVTRNGSSLRKNIRQNLVDPEVVHEIKKLKDRALGEAISAAGPGLIHNSLQHNEPIFSRSGIFGTVYRTALYPYLYSTAVVGIKEGINEAVLKRRHIINETGIAQSLIEGAIGTSGAIDPELRDKLIVTNQIHGDMLALEKKGEYKDIPRIVAKSPEARDESDHALMQQFCDEVGSKMIDNSARIFSALTDGKSGEAMEEVMERALQRPVNTLNDAVIALSFMHSMLEENAHNLEKLSFVSPDKVVLDRSALRKMSEFMNDQAANAGLAIHGVPVKDAIGSEFMALGDDDSLKEGELLQWNEKTQKHERASPETVMRYANVVTAKFRELAEKQIEKDSEGLVGRYAQAAKDRVFKHLESPRKNMPQHEVDGRFSELIANETQRSGLNMLLQQPETHQARILSEAGNTAVPSIR